MNRLCKPFLSVILACLCISNAYAFKKSTDMVAMRDQVHLVTDLYRPSLGNAQLPTILIRTPYNRTDALDETLIFSLVDLFGYNVVIQNTRGRYESEGLDSLFFADGWGKEKDGYDTVEWIAAQSWCNGKVGMLGASAMGITQYLAAGAAPPHLACCLVMVGASNLYADAIFQNGAYRRSLVDGWLSSIGSAALIPFFESHSNYSAIYSRIDLTTRFDSVSVPILHIGGWHDIFIQGQLNAFEGIRTSGGANARDNQQLIVGPWVHNLSSGNTGQLTYPESGISELLEPMIAWFDRWLKAGAGAENQPTVRYYLMGDTDQADSPGNRWIESDNWPPETTPVSFYLGGNQSLFRQLPTSLATSSSYVYDPDNPVPTIGGRNLNIDAGSYDQRSVESREDVLLFTTEPLTEPVTIAGKVLVRLYASSDAVDTDFTAKLTDVYPDGRSMLVADGILQTRHRNSIESEELMTPGEIYAFDIDLWSTAIVFETGHSIRLAISSSNFPRFEANPNTGHAFRADSLKRIANQTIYHQTFYPSALVLPVQGNSQSAIHVAHTPSTPSHLYLGANYPNPFNQQTQIPVYLPEQTFRQGTVAFEVTNVLGQTVWHEELGDFSPGFHLLSWHGTDGSGMPLPSGIYLARLILGNTIEVRKMGLNR